MSPFTLRTTRSASKQEARNSFTEFSLSSAATPESIPLLSATRTSAAVILPIGFQTCVSLRNQSDVEMHCWLSLIAKRGGEPGDRGVLLWGSRKPQDKYKGPFKFGITRDKRVTVFQDHGKKIKIVWMSN